jgi:hypothetical protein
MTRIKTVNGIPCKLWTGGVNNKGYGPHRRIFIAAHGPLPKGVQVMHVCDVRRCIELRHLVSGTNGDNMRDMVAKGRYVVGNHKGVAHGKAKLTEKNVLTIRRLSAQGVGQTELGRPAVWKIVNWKTWSHL